MIAAGVVAGSSAIASSLSESGGKASRGYANPTRPLEAERERDRAGDRDSVVKSRATIAHGRIMSRATAALTNYVQFNRGDVFVGGNTGGMIKHYNSAGTLVDTLTTGAVWQVTGMCFDEFGDMYATNFSDQTITKLDDTGHILQAQWGGFFNGRPEACTVDRNGNVYVGLVDSPTGVNELLKFNENGSLLAGWRPDVSWRGVDFFELAADNCTLLYTSEYVTIKRFDVCTGSQLTDFALPNDAQCWGVRIDPFGQVIAACADLNVIDGNGVVTHEWNSAHYSLYGLALDPSASTAWATASTSSQTPNIDLMQFDLQTGAILSTTSPDGGADGVAVFGSATPGQPGNGGIPPASPTPESTYGICDPRRYYAHNRGRVLMACAERAADPVTLATGAVSTSATDAAMQSTGVSFAFTRSYTSLDTSTSELGPGWTDSYADVLLFGTGQVTWRSGSGAQIVFTQQQDGSYQAPAWASVALTVVGANYELVDGDRTHYTFDAQGRLMAIKDPNGQGVTLGYDGQGNRSSVTDSAGRTVTFEHDAQGLLTRMVLPDARDVRYGYTNGQLTTVTDMRGNPYTYAYDANGRLFTETDQNNHQIVKNIYGADGRVSTQEDANHNVTTFGWDPATEVATVTDARNHTWTSAFDGTDLIRQSDPYGNTVHYVYDSSTGDLTKYRDPLGRDETMTYDSRHNMLTRTAPSPLSYQEVWTYNSFDEPLSYKDGRGNQTDYAYDAAGNLTTITGPDPDGAGPLGRPVTTYGRDPATGAVVSVTDPRLKMTQFTYFSATHQRSSMTMPLGGKTTFTYDATGRLKTAVEPRGNVTGGTPSDYTTTYDYDNADHLTKVTAPDPDGTGPQTAPVMQWAYDPAGNLQTATDANSHATDYGYDAANHLTSVTAPDPDGAGPLTRPVTQYTYDEVGNRKTRTVGGTKTTTYDYDDANRLISVLSPTGQHWTYGYDADGNRTSQVDAIGNSTPTAGDGTTTYGYDVLGRLTSIGYSDTTPAVSFAYDGANNRTQMTDGSGTETYAYDALNQLTGVTRGSATFSYQYDAAGNRTQVTYPDSTVVTATYDNDERLATVASGGLTTTYGYDVTGNQTTTTLPSANGYVETRTYDRDGRLTAVTNKKGATTLSGFTATLDLVGNPLTVTRTGTPSETATYTYDNLDRLLSVCYQASCPNGNDPYIRWTYDAVGNRLTETRPTGTKNYTYNNADQLTQAGTTNYTYDLNGNEKTAGSTTFNYDLANRLVSTTTGTTTTTFTYDGLGKRLQASTGSQATKKTNFFWVATKGLPEIALERNGNNALIRRYVYGSDLISMNTGSANYYFHYDRLGSVVNMTSSTGATEWTDSYEPWGPVRTETKNDTKAPANLMKFAGEYLDPTNLYHLRARDYDFTTGRFITTDPAIPAVADSYVSAYAYANDQPTTLTDPSGLNAGPGCGSGPGCWLKTEVAPYVTRCLSEAAVGAGAAWWTGEGAPAAAGWGCVQGLAAQAAEDHLGHEAGQLVELASRGHEAYGVVSKTEVAFENTVEVSMCGNSGSIVVSSSCTVIFDRGCHGAVAVGVGRTCGIAWKR